MRHKKKRPLTPLPRKLHINEKEWTYKIWGNNISIMVAIVNPELTLKHYIHASYIDPDFDIFWEEYNKSRDDEGAFGSMHFVLTPREIKNFIVKELLNKKTAIKMS